MGPDGTIKPEFMLTAEEKKSFVKLSSEQYEILKGLNRKERREYAKKNGLFKSGKFGWV